VLTDYTGALEWVESWRAADGTHTTVVWESRRWGRVGAQTVPIRARVDGASAIASVAKTTAVWNCWRSRAMELVNALGDGTDDSLLVAIMTHVRMIGTLDTTDFRRLRDVCRWLRTLRTFRDLWVAEPAPFRGTLDNLTSVELAALAMLRDEGNVRLEQERIAWGHALQRLALVL